MLARSLQRRAKWLVGVAIKDINGGEAAIKKVLKSFILLCKFLVFCFEKMKQPSITSIHQSHTGRSNVYERRLHQDCACALCASADASHKYEWPRWHWCREWGIVIFFFQFFSILLTKIKKEKKIPNNHEGSTLHFGRMLPTARPKNWRTRWLPCARKL